MASYTASEALHMILDSTEDPDSGDEEDPLFPLPRQESSGDESAEGGDESEDGVFVDEQEWEFGDESEEWEGQTGAILGDGSESDEDAGSS